MNLVNLDASKTSFSLVKKIISDMLLVSQLVVSDLLVVSQRPENDMDLLLLLAN